ncbi:type IV pilus assembly protein PilM [Solemya velum gill symbiont]|uniref:type IV pilus assembly protein PilM n=1 Tax=Solemya velum gill symbiont TaxID=2340 RepID=UPI000997F77C|nr:type IV pilus assembly protein PilM [Solemya velum gill symbiont]
MKALFGMGPKSLLGIDIGTSAVKLLELEADSGDSDFSRIKSLSVVPLPEGAVEGKQIVDPDDVVAALAEVVKLSGSSVRSVAAAVSGVTAITRILKLPANLSDREMETEVEFEADKKIPQPLDEIRYDYDILGLSEADPDTVDVLLVASREDVVGELTSILELAGLKPAVIDVESYAINHCYNLARSDSEPECVAVADIGASSIDFHVMKGETVSYTREYNFGGRALTRALQGQYGLSFQEAEKMKVDEDWPSGARESVVQDFLSSLTQEVRGALQIYQAAGKGEKIMRLYLAGGCAAMPGVEEVIGDVLDFPVSVLNPLTDLKHPRRITEGRLKMMGPAMIIACGLATRRPD